MHAMPEMISVTELAKNHVGVLERLKENPVLLLAQHSRPAAVMIRVAEWNNLIAEVQQYRRLLLIDQRVDELTANPNLAIPWEQAVTKLHADGVL